MMNRRKCRSCYYHGLSGFAGVTCEYILITGKSRVLQMTPEERKGSCPFYEEIPRAKRTQRIVYSQNGLWG